MFHHLDLGKTVFSRTRKLKSLIEKGDVAWGGNSLLKIYGKLSCRSGKRMKPGNRVFFSSELEAIEHGYRPCGHCMNDEYKNWKNGSI
jgi:methylphosphotriester-DNA--protein-cysteine methyltransferase